MCLRGSISGMHFYPGSTSAAPVVPIKTDMDTLRETYRFIRTEEDDSDRSWAQRLAKRYYDKLFKEYCIADMSRYKESKIGFRWRTEKEVVCGKGQFVCGNRKCSETEGLSSYEVNFSYKESNEIRQALVKLRVCPRCARKLKYRKVKELENQLREEKRRARKRRRKENSKRQSKKRRTSTDSDEGETSEDTNGTENRSRSRSDGSKFPCSKEQKPNDSTEVPSNIITGGASHKATRNDEYDQYFEGMFL